jgi:hypothetical protein
MPALRPLDAPRVQASGALSAPGFAGLLLHSAFCLLPFPTDSARKSLPLRSAESMLATRVVPWETRTMQSNPMLQEIWRIKNLKHLPQVSTQEAKAANHLLARARLR